MPEEYRNPSGIHQEFEGGVEKSVPRITAWHHKPCGVMTNSGPEGQIFLSCYHTNNRFFFLLIKKIPNIFI